MEQISIGILVMIVFIAGWGWGQWYSERNIRAERSELEKGRVSISMPMHNDDAKNMMRLLNELIEQVDADKAAAGIACCGGDE